MERCAEDSWRMKKDFKQENLDRCGIVKWYENVVLERDCLEEGGNHGVIKELLIKIK